MSQPASTTSWKVTRFGAPLQEVVEPVRAPRGREVLLRVAARPSPARARPCWRPPAAASRR